MNIVIIYDPSTGTSSIAEAISSAMPIFYDTEIFPLEQTLPFDTLVAADLLIIGSPDDHGQPTAAMQRLLSTLPRKLLSHKLVALFDTRTFPSRTALVHRLKKLSGHAATRMAAIVRSKGARQAAHTETFETDGSDPQNLTDEIKRARQWAKQLAAQMYRQVPFPMP